MRFSRLFKILFPAFVICMLGGVAFSSTVVEINTANLLVTFVLLFLVNLPLKERTLSRNSLDYLAAAYLAVALVSVVRSPYFAESMRAFWSKAFQGALLYFIVRNYFSLNKGAIKYVQPLMVFIAVVLSINGFFQYMTGHDFIRGFEPNVIFEANKALETKRITASMRFPNDLGIYLAFLIPVIFVVFAQVRKIWTRALLAACFLIVLAALVMTYSRSAWVSLLVSSLILAIISRKKRFLLMIGMLIAVISFLPRTSAFIRNADPGSFLDETIRGRIVSSREAVEMARGDLFLGSGINTYDTLNKEMHPGKQEYPYAHNCYLQMLVELGLPGLLVFLAFLFALFVKSSAYIRRMGEFSLPLIGMYGGLLALSVSFLFDTHFYNTSLSMLFWLSCGVVAGLSE